MAALAGVPGAAVFFTAWLEVGFLLVLLLVVPFQDAFVHRARVTLVIIGVVQLVCMLGLLSGASCVPGWKHAVVYEAVVRGGRAWASAPQLTRSHGTCVRSQTTRTRSRSARSQVAW